MNTKSKLVAEMEKQGLGFTANVIVNGCGKPCTKMKTILEILSRGFDVRPAQFETCQVLIKGRAIWLEELDKGTDQVLGSINSTDRQERNGGKPYCFQCNADHDPIECLKAALS